MKLQQKISALKKLKAFEADEIIHTQHEIIFGEINCLDCANCCKSTPALLNQEDINRISKYLKIDKQTFIKQYTKIDEDNDLIFKKTPCIFLEQNNKCKIYEVRPFACKDYPHTKRKNQMDIVDITIENYKICPAVQQIFNNIEFE